MSQHTESDNDFRDLSSKEYRLVAWLLQNGEGNLNSYLSQLDKVKVIGKCPCGCASVDFSVAGKVPDQKAGLEVLSDYIWRSGNENLMGVFAFAKNDQLAGLEVWSVDGIENPIVLPAVEKLIPFSGGINA